MEAEKPSPEMKKLLTIALPFLAVTGIAFGLYKWNAGQMSEALIGEHVPPIPPTKGLNPDLVQRIEKRNQQSIAGPDNQKALAQLAQLYHANGYLNHAWQCYRILIAIDSRNPQWPYRLGVILSSYGQLDDSATLYRKTITLDPDYTPARIQLGDTLLKLNHLKDAEEAYQSILDNQPENPFALFGRGRVALARDDTDQATRYLQSALKHSNQQIGGDLLADVYEKQGKIAKARQLLHSVTWSSHYEFSDPWIDYMIDDCYDSYQISLAAGKASRYGKPSTAIRLLHKAARLDPLDYGARYHLANLSRNTGKLDQAREHYTVCTEIAPTFADGWISLIDIETKTNNLSRIPSLTRLALRTCPQSPALNNLKGNQLMKTNRIDEAIPYFKKAIKYLPHEAIGYTHLARAYLKQGNEEAGIEQMLLALKAEPSNPFALNSLTYYYIVNGNRKEATEYLQRASKSPRISEDELRNLISQYKAQFSSP